MEKLGNFLDFKSEAPALNEFEFEKLKSDEYNNTAGNLNEYDNINCPHCNNKGYVSKVKYIELYKQYTTIMYRCTCMDQRETIRKALNSGLGEYLKRRSNDYEATEEWQKLNKSLMVEYCKTESDSNKWFIAVGQSGGGKTLLCSIIANHLLFNLNKQVLYITWTDFISKLKRDIMSDNSDAVSIYLDEVKKCEVLFIDELLKKYTETDLKYIIEIINYRYTNDLKTIITSERMIDELLDIDEATFGRVIEKSGKYLIEIEKDRHKNYRLKALR